MFRNLLLTLTLFLPACGSSDFKKVVGGKDKDSSSSGEMEDGSPSSSLNSEGEPAAQSSDESAVEQADAVPSTGNPAPAGFPGDVTESGLPEGLLRVGTKGEVKEQAEGWTDEDFEKLETELTEFYEGKRIRFKLTDFPGGSPLCLQFSTLQDQCVYKRTLMGQPDYLTGSCRIAYGDPFDTGRITLEFMQEQGTIINITPNILLNNTDDWVPYNDLQGLMQVVEPEECPISADAENTGEVVDPEIESAGPVQQTDSEEPSEGTVDTDGSSTESEAKMDVEILSVDPDATFSQSEEL